jgi:putative transposase
MARRLRVAAGGVVYHVLNRSVGRRKLFRKDGDYAAFEKALGEAFERMGVPVLAYCLMPNHWHLVLWPAKDGQLSTFVRLLSVTHTQRYHAHYHTAGTGPIYQGRFKSFPVQEDRHLLVCCRYVERNAVRAGLSDRAAKWPWCGTARAKAKDRPPWLLPRSRWPVEVPRDWERWVDEPQTDAEVAALREAVQRGRPFGDEPWQRRTAVKLKLEPSLRPPHRPKKKVGPPLAPGSRKKDS